MEKQMNKTVLLTGANGKVGAFLRPLLRERYQTIVLSDRTCPPDITDGEIFRAAELTNPDEVMAAVEGVDAIIHLGGQSVEADWQTILTSNIDGTYNLFEAARAHNVERVIYASSHHAIGMYDRQRRVGTDARPRPDSRYGVSKVLGEALAAFYADKFGLRTLSIRIGHVAPRPVDFRRLSVWLHPEDLMQLIEIGISSDEIHAQIVYGVSHNVRSFWDNSVALALGYRPVHKAEDHYEFARQGEEDQISKEGPADPIALQLQGAAFAAKDFDGDIERIIRR